MSETIFIALAVGALFYFLYERKKQKERQMGEELDSLIEREDWQRVSRFIHKQLVIWIVITVFAVAIVVAKTVRGDFKPFHSAIIALCLWRVFQLARSYRNSRNNERMKSIQEEELADIEEETARVGNLLRQHNINVTRLKTDISVQEAMKILDDARERGKQDGVCPVLLSVDRHFMESLAFIENNEEALLSSPIADGQALLKARFDNLKEDYEKEYDWETDIVGTAKPDQPEIQFIFENCGLLLAEIPVDEPWKVFAYLPFGGWNDCPETAEHMAIAKYWYEKYGAEVALIASETLFYKVAHPVVDDAMKLAEEQLAYSADMLQDYENLSELAAVNKRSTLWRFWWD